MTSSSVGTGRKLLMPDKTGRRPVCWCRRGLPSTATSALVTSQAPFMLVSVGAFTFLSRRIALVYRTTSHNDLRIYSDWPGFIPYTSSQ